MRLVIDDEFIRICASIVEQADRGEPFVDDEDAYQTAHFCGGWASDGDLGPGFYMSYYAPDGGDYIVYFTVDQAREVFAGNRMDPWMRYWKESPLKNTE